ncbi:Hypothetical predicted protein [Prunus dulcis]|uniref:Uncharacterized protein n=1 Tax=Prunus dulcis TaxID=3755 RepID=A0A5E4EXE5_PRUDU|nr:Hypothetical predicted protein [Prunus dulcis]
MGGDNDDESHDYESGDFGGLGIMTNIATFSSRNRNGIKKQTSKPSNSTISPPPPPPPPPKKEPTKTKRFWRALTKIIIIFTNRGKSFLQCGPTTCRSFV